MDWVPNDRRTSATQNTQRHNAMVMSKSLHPEGYSVSSASLGSALEASLSLLSSGFESSFSSSPRGTGSLLESSLEPSLGTASGELPLPGRLWLPSFAASLSVSRPAAVFLKGSSTKVLSFSLDGLEFPLDCDWSSDVLMAGWSSIFGGVGLLNKDMAIW